MPGFFIFEDQRLIPNHLRQLQKNRHEGAERVETAKMKLLLICGILAPVLYFCTDILGGMLWQGYSFVNQAVSELSAISSPTRSFVVPLYLVYDGLLIAFGFGVYGFSQKRAMRVTGGLLVGLGVVGFAGTPFPLQLGVAEAAFGNTMHSVIAGLTVILYLLAMGFGAFACGKRFRLYSFGTIVTLIVVGSVSALMAGAEISARGWTAPPQWFGLIERVSVYGSILWVMVLAIVLWREEKGPGLIRAGN